MQNSFAKALVKNTPNDRYKNTRFMLERVGRKGNKIPSSGFVSQSRCM